MSAGSPRGWGHILGCGEAEFASQGEHDAHFRATNHDQHSNSRKKNKWGQPDQKAILMAAFAAIRQTPDDQTLDKFAKALAQAERR